MSVGSVGGEADAGGEADTAPDAVGIEDSPATSALRGALELLQAMSVAESVFVAWRTSRDGAVESLSSGEPPSEEHVRRGLALAEDPAAEQPSAAEGIAVVPLRLASSEVGAGGAVVLVGPSQPLQDSTLTLVGSLLAELTDALQAQVHRPRAFEALVHIGTQIQAREAHVESVLESIVVHARGLLGTEVAWLALVEGGRARVQAAVGAQTDRFGEMEAAVGTGVGGRALVEGRPIVLRGADLYAVPMSEGVRAVYEAEGLVSVLCAPMLLDGGMVGALYVGFRHLAEFGAEAVSLLAALGTQAAVTIQNARLYEQLADQNEALELSLVVHRALTDVSLSGRGLEATAGELARLLDRDVVLEIDSGERGLRFSAQGTATHSASRREAHAETAVRRAAAAAVMAGTSRLGQLWVVGDEPLTPVQRRTLEQGATVIALELVKEQAGLEVEWRMQGELLEELLRAPARPPLSLVERAERAGIDLSERHRVAVLRSQRAQGTAELLDFARRSLRSRPELSGLAARRDETVVLVLPGEPETVRRDLAEIQRRAQRAGTPFSGGLSRGHDSMAIALRQAEAALRLAQQQDGALVGYEDLGPMRFLLDAPDLGEITAVVRESLGPLAEYDRARGGELMSTLAAFLESGGHQPTTCGICHIHVSTLKYRLARIAEVLDCSLNDPDVRFQLRLALELDDVLQLLGVRAFDAGRS